MAGVDKIYGTKFQLNELRRWLKKHKPEFLDNVYDYERDYRKGLAPDAIITISNFRCEQDLWLWENCDIPWVLARLKEQYGNKGPNRERLKVCLQGGS